jgi:hypothetical protein
LMRVSSWTPASTWRLLPECDSFARERLGWGTVS